MEFSELNNPFQKKTKTEQKRFTRKWLPQKLFFTYPYVALNEHTWQK